MKVNNLLIKLLVLFAAVLRFAFLDWKAPHFDEGINGHFVMQTWSLGFFNYDPSNYHGPLYFYYLQLAEILMGRGILTFRIATALLASAIVYVTAIHARYIGRAAYWAAAVLAVSPAFVFYGRYAIHETMLILFQVVFSYGFLKWHSEKNSRGIHLMVVGIFGSFSTKETFFIFLGCWLIALAAIKLVNKLLPKKLRFPESIPSNSKRRQAPNGEGLRQNTKSLKTWALSGAVGIFATLALFSGFFLDLQGISDMFTAFAFWTKTGTGHTGHEKPFFYWVQVLWIYEWPLLLALLTTVIASLWGSFYMRLYSAVGFGIWLAYSIIPYKTPWCVIGFWPLAIALGFLLVEFPNSSLRTALKGLALASIIFSLSKSLELNFKKYHDPKEKYVYVQSTNDVNILTETIAKRVAEFPEDATMKIQVFIRDTWPLPWLLSTYSSVQYGQLTHNDGLGEVILIDGADQAKLEGSLTRKYLRIPFHMRDAYGSGFAYFAEERFSRFMKGAGVVVGAK